MRSLWWIVISAAGVLICGAVAVFATQGGARSETGAAATMSAAPVTQAELPRPAPAPAPVQEAQQTRPTPPAAAAPGRATPEAPRRVETTQYDSWVVTCQDTVGGTAKKTCVADLRLVNQDRGTILNWQIGLNEEGHFVTAIHIPSALSVKSGDKTVGGPISIPSGIELKFGNGAVRRLNFVTCGPQQCVAEALIDDAFVKEANANTKATITIHTPGGVIPFELAINGIDKAITYAR
jgi:invasion protein IalB